MRKSRAFAIMMFSLWRAFFAYGIISSISTERITYLRLCQEKRSGGEICYAAGVRGRPRGGGYPPYHWREVATLGADRLGIDASLGADRANSTNSAGECHRPNDSSAAVAMERTRLASLSPRH